MTLPVNALSQYVEVLDQRAQQRLAETGQARTLLERTRHQLERLRNMAQSAEVKKLHGSVALYANAAGFRSGLLDMVEQCRDTCEVRQLEYAQTQVALQLAYRQHGSMQSVLEQAQTGIAVQQRRQEQKLMDELAGQAWLRQSGRHGHETR